jgi:hypothetical protein
MRYGRSTRLPLASVAGSPLIAAAEAGTAFAIQFTIHSPALSSYDKRRVLTKPGCFGTRTYTHPRTGPYTLDRQLLLLPQDDQPLMVLTAPDPQTLEALDRLGSADAT